MRNRNRTHPRKPLLLPLLAALLALLLPSAPAAGLDDAPMWRNLSLPWHAAANTCYVPVADAAEFPALAAESGWRLADPGAGPDAADGGYAVRLPGGRTLRAIPVTLPVLCIDVPGGALPGDEDTGASLRLYEPMEAGGVRCVETPIEINIRGNTSRRYPKKSYRVKIVDEAGVKQNLVIAGLRSDDDWILNPMYSDTSKIREAVSYRLWDLINRSGQAAASSRVAYAEVLLNGEYWGIYGVQERVDRKQVNADRRAGILYKVTANDKPTPAELLACDSDEACKGFELQFAGDFVTAPWAPAADYMAALEGGQGPGIARLSRNNAVDYGLWSALVQARDGHFKNMFIHAAPDGGGYTLYRIPWDLNHTLGDLWASDSEATNYLDYAVTRPALDDLLAARLDAGDSELPAAMAERWRALRQGPLAERGILEWAENLFDALYPAIMRDGLRWPECGMGEGNAANIRDIEDYFRVMLPRLDGWLDVLSRGEAMEDAKDGEAVDR